jgi:hypothetical protein
VEGISSSAREQSASLAEVNTGVAQLDRVTQQNAAMVSQANDAGRTLRDEANAMAESIAIFKLPHGARWRAWKATPAGARDKGGCVPGRTDRLHGTSCLTVSLADAHAPCAWSRPSRPVPSHCARPVDSPRRRDLTPRFKSGQHRHGNARIMRRERVRRDKNHAEARRDRIPTT